MKTLKLLFVILITSLISNAQMIYSFDLKRNYNIDFYNTQYADNTIWFKCFEYSLSAKYHIEKANINIGLGYIVFQEREITKTRPKIIDTVIVGKYPTQYNSTFTLNLDIYLTNKIRLNAIYNYKEKYRSLSLIPSYDIFTTDKFTFTLGFQYELNPLLVGNSDIKQYYGFLLQINYHPKSLK